jgi:hypothetical protein
MPSQYVLNRYPYPQAMTTVQESIHHVSHYQSALVSTNSSSQHHWNRQLVCCSCTSSVFPRSAQSYRKSIHRHRCQWPMRRQHCTHPSDRLRWTLFAGWSSSHPRCRLCICLPSWNHYGCKLGQIADLPTWYGDGNGVQGQGCEYHSSVSYFFSIDRH